MESRHRPTITLFGSSRPEANSPNYSLAYDLGRVCAEAGFRLANGGYGGTMEASAKGAKEAGGTTVGVTCDAFGRKGPNNWIDEEIRTPNLAIRLQTLIDLGDAYIALPGSTGTLLELAMVWELINKRFLAARPLICLTDFWRPLVDTLIRSGETDGACVVFAATPDEAVDLVRNANCLTHSDLLSDYQRK